MPTLKSQDQSQQSQALPAVRAPSAGGHTASLSRTASWVLREKSNGKVIMETFDPAKVAALNTTKYEAVPIQQYLSEVNKAARDAANAAFAPTAPIAPAAPVEPTWAQQLYAATAQMLAMSGGGSGMQPSALDPRITRNDAEAALQGGYGISRPVVTGNAHEEPLRLALQNLLALSGGVSGMQTSTLDPVAVQTAAVTALGDATAYLLQMDSKPLDSDRVDQGDQADQGDSSADDRQASRDRQSSVT